MSDEQQQRPLEPWFRWGLTVLALADAAALAATLGGLGVPVWLLLAVGLLVTGAPAIRFWSRRLNERALTVERQLLADRRETYSPPADVIELPKSAY